MSEQRKVKGYILVITLLFLQVTTLMGLYMLFSVKEQIRVDGDRWLNIKELLAAKRELVNIENKIEQLMALCALPIQSSSEFVSKDMNWWQRKACTDHVREKVYYYTIEKLESDECAFIGKSSGNSPWIAQYYRITLYAPISKLKIILQSTLAIPAHNDLSCTSTGHTVMSGRQMLRELF